MAEGDAHAVDAVVERGPYDAGNRSDRGSELACESVLGTIEVQPRAIQPTAAERAVVKFVLNNVILQHRGGAIVVAPDTISGCESMGLSLLLRDGDRWPPRIRERAQKAVAEYPARLRQQLPALSESTIRSYLAVNSLPIKVDKIWRERRPHGASDSGAAGQKRQVSLSRPGFSSDGHQALIFARASGDDVNLEWGFYLLEEGTKGRWFLRDYAVITQD